MLGILTNNPLINASAQLPGGDLLNPATAIHNGVPGQSNANTPSSPLPAMPVWTTAYASNNFTNTNFGNNNGDIGFQATPNTAHPFDMYVAPPPVATKTAAPLNTGNPTQSNRGGTIRGGAPYGNAAEPSDSYIFGNMKNKNLADRLLQKFSTTPNKVLSNSGMTI